MRYPLLLVLLLTSATGAAAGDPAARESGGFGGPVIKYTRVHGQGAFMVGGRGAWVIHHSLRVGGGGYGVFTDVNAPTGALGLDRPLDIELGYGGLEVEYAFHPDRKAHLVLSTLVGAGSARYVKDVGPVSQSNEQVGASDTIFVWEPAAGAEFNVTPWFRVNPTLSYRLVAGVGQDRLRNGDLSGVAATVGFRFGSF